MTGVKDELNVRYATFKYDCHDRALSTEQANGVYKFSFGYTALYASPRNTVETDPLGAVRTWRYARAGSTMLPTGVSQKDPLTGAITSTTALLDAHGNATERTNFNNWKTCYVQDQVRNLESARIEGLAASAVCSTLTNASLPAGTRKTSTAWHPDWRLPVKVAEPGRLTWLIYNGQRDPFNSDIPANCAPTAPLLPDGKPIAVLCRKIEQATTDVNGSQGFIAALQSGVANRVSNWTYDAYGQVLTEDGPRKDIIDKTQYDYYTDTTVDYTLGDLKQVTNAAGELTVFTKYNKHGQVLESKDANGTQTVNTYDLRQRLMSVKVGNRLTTYDYYDTGQLKKITQPDTSWIGFDYDDAHRQSAVYDHLSNRIKYTLDNAGNRMFEETKDPGNVLRRQLQRNMDALGRVQQTTGLQ